MAKKSTAARQANAARRSQTTSKAPEVTLVRQPKTGSEDVAVSTAAPSAGAALAKPAKNGAVPATARTRAPEAAKPATVTVAAKTPESVPRAASRSQANRTARAQANQRARAASQISPQHYSYVRDDLRLIAILASSMFFIILVLHFVLPI
ncbi:MAG: hypothetical protein ACLQUY_20735 [Ktedonobacterales bacterium]